jgi:Cu(I)/Ag(I) efflux system membrane fusion protein
VKTGTAFIALAVAATLGATIGYQFAPPATLPTAQPPAAGQPARKLLYYRNPMGLPDTSPVPKKDPMGMDYIPVHEGEDAGADKGLRISPEKIQKLGVQTAHARLQTLDRVVRANGRVEVDERRTHAITAKFEGYVERLLVNTTGQPVVRGQPLFQVYSPELVSAQQEYALAAQGAASLAGAGPQAQEAMAQLAQASLLRLRNWDISEAQIKALAQSGEAKRTLTFHSPVAGVVMEKKAVEGMRFMAGETLFQVADLSALWVQAEVFEQDLALVRPRQKARVRINAYPGEVFEGSIAYVYPTLNPETRAVPVRIELANPGGRLKPAMYAEVEIPVGGAAPALTVPASAVIDSGRRQVVLVQRAEGRFEPREVKLGGRGQDWVEILAGVTNGETVVVAANFLIDAESNLKAALAGMQAPEGAGPARVGHRAEGVLKAVDAAAGTVTLSHGPVASLNWPAMKMEFALANPALIQGIAPGSQVTIEFVERQPGEWVITAMKPAARQR